MEHLSLEDEKIPSIESWQQRVAQSIPDASQPLRIGFFWRNIVSDLYLSMLERPFWGWSLDEDVRFLDFWQEYDSSIRFILFTAPPAFYLSYLLERHRTVFQSKTVAEWIDLWADYHQKILAFHLRHTTRSALLSMEDFLKAPVKIFDHLGRLWPLPPLQAAATKPDAWRPAPLVRFLIDRALPHRPDIASLLREIDDCRLTLETQKAEALGAEDVSPLIASYIDLHSQALLAKEREKSMAGLRQERDALAGEKAKTESELAGEQRLRGSLEQENSELRQRVETLGLERKKLEDENGESRKKQKDLAYLAQKRLDRLNNKTAECDALAGEKERAQKENDLLVKQLQQVQVELEEQYLKRQQAEASLAQEKKRAAALAQEVKKLKQDRDVQVKLAQERLSVLSKRTEERDWLAVDRKKSLRELAALREDRDAQVKLAQERLNVLSKRTEERDWLAVDRKKCLRELATLREDRDAQVKLAQERLNALVQRGEERDWFALDRKKCLRELAALREDRDAQAKLAQERLDVLSKRTEERDWLALDRKKYLRENARLFPQLHQFQEQLDLSSQRLQETQQEVERWKARWEQLLASNPDCSDCESLTIENEPDARRIRWRFENIGAAGRMFPALEFHTVLEGSAGEMVFNRESAAGALVRWPAAMDAEETLRIILQGHDDARTASAQAFQLLGPSDLALVYALARFLVARGLDASRAREILDEQSRSTLRRGLLHFLETADQFPPVFRYDRVALKREQKNPDYEHLWLRFENVCFGEARTDAFEFRVSCMLDSADAFGKRFKLEFPEQEGAGLFERWYEESRDDFSGKWELRFAVPGDMDVTIWNSVSRRDHALLVAIAAQLPHIFSELSSQGFTPQRGWDQWKELAGNASHILTLHTQAG